MKMLKLAALGLAVLLYTTAAVAQHGHAGGVGGGMGVGAGVGMGAGVGVDHGAGVSTHGNVNANTSTSASAHGPAIGQVLQKNPAIGDKITTLTGDKSATDACTGFKNLGQCVAAAHVSKNLGLNFYCLRQTMTTTAVPTGTSCPASTNTSTKGMSLGKAIQTLDPQADSKSESKKGEVEAEQDLKASGEIS